MCSSVLPVSKLLWGMSFELSEVSPVFPSCLCVSCGLSLSDCGRLLICVGLHNHPSPPPVGTHKVTWLSFCSADGFPLMLVPYHNLLWLVEDAASANYVLLNEAGSQSIELQHHARRNALLLWLHWINHSRQPQQQRIVGQTASHTPPPQPQSCSGTLYFYVHWLASGVSIWIVNIPL